MINCLIVDDEPNAHAVLINYIDRNSKLKLIAQAYSAIEADLLLRDNNIDLIFLDINMPEMTGIEYLKTKQNDAQIILTTAYSDYALDGFNFGVVDYLLKPIPFPRFEQAIEKAKILIEKNKVELFIHFKIDGIKKKFLYSDIIYFQSLGNYVKIVTTSKNYLVIMTLLELEKQLQNNYFVRIHKSYIVPRHIIVEKTHLQKISIAELQIPVGRTYKDIVLEILSN
jgi:two-component system, LytTR family, response regulator